MSVKNELMHYGILGMRWGIRRTPEQLGRREERKLKKSATKDAERTAVAKAAYGKGAGIQRRLVKTDIDSKLKNPAYKKYYDEALASLNSSKVVNKAVANSRGRATKEQTTRTAKMVAKYLTGTTSLAAAYILYANNKEVVHRFVGSAINAIKRG